MDNHKIRNSCMLCGSSIDMVWDFKPTPLANSYRTNTVEQDKYPLHLSRCRKCFHIQCPVIVRPELMFEDYLYVSGTSPAFVQHFLDYARYVEKTFDLKDHNLVVEIGSNDGTLLKQFKCRTIGVDPSKNISAQANADGITTLCDYFDSKLADEIISRFGFADVVVANNVMAHIEDLPSVFSAVKELLNPRGVFIFEISYWGDVLSNGLFDTVYHEHLHYHTISTLRRFVESIGMEIFHVEMVPTHGGSIRVFAGKAKAHVVLTSVNWIIESELNSGIHGDALFSRIRCIREKQEIVRSELNRISKSARGRVIGYGSPAKSVTLSSELELDPSFFHSIVDDSPFKQNKVHPLMDCKIVPFSQVLNEPNDTFVILAWNFAKQIKQKLGNSPSYTPNFSLKAH